MSTIMKCAMALSVALIASNVQAAALEYRFDSSHSQILFSYQHLGFSTTSGMFTGIRGTITFDHENPEASSVSAEIPLATLITGDKARDEHFLSADFFGGAEKPKDATFKSTSIETLGDRTGRIIGDLTLNGVRKQVVLHTVLNQKGQHPMEKKSWIGFDATTKINRSDFNLGMYAPAVSDEVEIKMSVEASATK